MKSLDWYPWYWRRWAGSRRVLRMTLAERGLYRELLDQCWNVGSVPDDPDEVAELVFGAPAETANAWPAVRRMFARRDDGRLYYPEMSELRQRQLDRYDAAVESGRKGGLARASKAASRLPQATLKQKSRIETTLNSRATRPRPSGGGGPVAISAITHEAYPPGHLMNEAVQ